MTLVKIKVDKNKSGYCEKYLLQFIPQIHYTVKDFLKMAKQILDIDWPLSQIIILKSGYMIPHSLSSRIFIKYQQSSFKIIHLTDKKPIKSNKNRQNSQQPQQSSQQNNSSLSSSQSQEVQQKIKKTKTKTKGSTLNVNNKKKIKNKKMDIQDQDQENQQNQSSQSSQQSQSSELPVIGNKKNQLQEKKKQKVMKKQKVAEKQNSSENQSNLTQKLISNKNKSNVSSSIKQGKGQDKKALLILQNKKINRNQKKKIIEMDSSSQESSSQQKQKFKVNNVNKAQITQSKIVSQQHRNNQNSIKIPPSLRQKTQKNAFKTHQQQQWIPVSKQTLKKHYELQQNKQVPFVKINNLIRFKIIELDQQRFVPVSSQWIEGTITSINSQGKITLSKVTQINRPFRQTYQIFQHNMLELLINKNFILKEQTLFINSDKPEQNRIELSQEKKREIQNKDQQKNEEKCSIEKFICGQVNFYFSDKNYPTDLFMRMHANNHPQKYFPIRVMLNFPKIKKVLKDENKLFGYLCTDEKKSQRNFQIDEINKMIRKKEKNNINQNNNEPSLVKEDQKQQQVNKI